MQKEIYTNTTIIQVYESWQHLFFLSKETAVSNWDLSNAFAWFISYIASTIYIF